LSLPNCHYQIDISKNHYTLIDITPRINHPLLVKLIWLGTLLLLFNPIPAGVLETQDMLGGSICPPPSKSNVLCPNMTSDTSLESSCALL